MEDELKSRLVELLTNSQAHMGFNEAVKDFPLSQINTKFPHGQYSAWGLLEHIRITQADILEFMVATKYLEKDWPKDYWPDPKLKATPKSWQATIDQYQADLKYLVKLVKDPKTQLAAKVPNGTGQTILREILVVADHTAYHIGEFAILRQVMSTWPKSSS
jgi:hypothetical protein